jgi:hypothetical protein
MKTERRHELQHNVLADKLGQWIEVIEPHGRTILGAALGLVVILFVWALLHARDQETADRAWDSFFDALAARDPNKLSKTAEEFSSTRASQWARLMDADLLLNQGVRQLFTDRPDARDQIKRSADMYTTVITESEEKSPLIPRAKYGRARAHESLGELTMAREEYNDIVREGGPFARAAKDRALDLDQSSTKAFYDWFARYEPPRPATGPDAKLDFNKEPLDRSGDAKPPAAGASAAGNQTPDATAPDSGAAPPSSGATPGAEKQPSAEARPDEPSVVAPTQGPPSTAAPNSAPPNAAAPPPSGPPPSGPPPSGPPPSGPPPSGPPTSGPPTSGSEK